MKNGSMYVQSYKEGKDQSKHCPLKTTRNRLVLRRARKKFRLGASPRHRLIIINQPLGVEQVA